MSDKLFLCKYRVPTLVFMMNDQKILMDASNVLSIEKLDDYEFNLRSILKLSLRIDIRKKLWIMKNKRNIVCKFELDRVGIDNTSETFLTGSEEIWNEEFGIYFNDEEEASDTKVMEARIAKNEGTDFVANDIETENYFESQNILDVYLFNRSLLNASNNKFNDIMTEGVLQDFVGKLLTVTKHPRKVLISKFENDEVYKELLCPSLPAYKALSYLDQYYGFYKKGSIIYYDVDFLYIINANGKMTAKRDGEWSETTILAKTLDESSPGDGMLRKDGEKTFYISINDSNINPQNFANNTNANIGSEAKVVVTDDITIDMAEATQSYVDQRNEQIVYKTKGDNKYLSNMIKARMEENDCILYISGDNLDIDSFRPNKIYQIVFEETSKQQKYGKYKYRLAYSYVMLKAESEEYMKSSHRFVLKRAPEDDEDEKITSTTNGQPNSVTKF